MCNKKLLSVTSCHCLNQAIYTDLLTLNGSNYYMQYTIKRKP